MKNSSRRFLLIGNRSGGAFYHLKAAFYSRALWDSHRKSVAAFLENWTKGWDATRYETLILVGSSAGYSLPPRFVNRFQNVIAYEPDVIARKIFEKRFGILPNWKTENAFVPGHRFPEGVILFCNVLGQLHWESEFKSQLLDRLEKRVWASYHDAYSVQANGRTAVRFRAEKREPIKVTEAEVSSWVDLESSRNSSAREIALHQHEALELFTDAESARYFYWEWRITQKSTHLIEGVYGATPK